MQRIPRLIIDSFTFLVILFGLTVVFASRPVVNVRPVPFGTPKSDVAWAIARHPTGLYIVGTTEGHLARQPQGGRDGFVRKLSTDSRVLWARQFGTPQDDDAQNVVVDGTGNVYVGGYTTGSLAGSHGNSDIFVRKYSSGGRLLWTRQFGSKSQEYGGPMAAFETSIYVAGHVIDAKRNETDALLLKLDSNGKRVWSRVFGTAGMDYASDATTDHLGNVYVAGLWRGIPSGDIYSSADMYLRKYTPDGVLVWKRRLDTSHSELAMKVLLDGASVYLAGQFRRSPKDVDARLVKFKPNGDKVWDKRIDPGGQAYVYGLSVNRGAVFFGGQAINRVGDSDGYVVKLAASDGRQLWQTNFATPTWDSVWALLATSAGVYVAGETGGQGGTVVSFANSVDAFLNRLHRESGEALPLREQ